MSDDPNVHATPLEPLPPVPDARGGLHVLLDGVWTPVPVEPTDPAPAPEP